MKTQLNDFNYPDVYKWYDEERRERTGSYLINDVSSGMEKYHFNGVQKIQHFDYHLTSVRNTIPIQLTSYANGIKIVWDSYLDHYDEDYAYINGDLKFIDKNGNNVSDYIYRNAFNTEPYYAMVVPVSLQHNTISDISLNYTSHELVYNSITDSANIMRTVQIISDRNTSSPYNPPELNGDVSVSEFSNYYNGVSGLLLNSNNFELYFNALNHEGDGTPISPIMPSDDTSTPGGGDQADPDYNPFSDPVDFPGLPTGGSAIASGFIRVYSPTSSQLQALAGKLWGNDFINTIHKIMNDPMEAMISLHSVPFQIVGGSNANIEVGNFDTEVSAKTVTTQYYTLDCGNISLPEHWASALDYSPYTTVDIFIPFVGVRPLQIDDVMGRVLNLKYNIDVLTGCAIAMLKCGDSVLYTYNTQVHTEIPYTMSSYGRLVQSIIGVAGTAIGATAGGAGALIGASIGGALGTAMTKHSDISRGGSLGGAVGVMGDFTPYLIIHRPIQSLASDFASKKGYPSNISATLSSVSGYTVVDKIHLTNIDCTDTERDEIHALLKEGVII